MEVVSQREITRYASTGGSVGDARDYIPPPPKPYTVIEERRRLFGLVFTGILTRNDRDWQDVDWEHPFKGEEEAVLHYSPAKDEWWLSDSDGYGCGGWMRVENERIFSRWLSRRLAAKGK